MKEKVKFADLWASRLSYRLVPLEEGWVEHWSWGRFVCIGDAIHKVILFQVANEGNYSS